MIKRTRSILVVGKEKSWVENLTKSLISNGHRTLIARNQAHALSILEFRAVDIVVADLLALNGDDRDLISYARSTIPTPQIILIGKADPNIQDYLAGEKITLVPKPADVGRLIAFMTTFPQRRSSFSGLVEDVDLIEYFQFVVLGSRKTILEVTSLVGTQGKIYLADGLVLHAELGVLKGEQAFYSCLCFKEGTFSHLPWEEPEELTINKPGEFLLMEAVRRRDEAWSDGSGAGAQD